MTFKGYVDALATELNTEIEIKEKIRSVAPLWRQTAFSKALAARRFLWSMNPAMSASSFAFCWFCLETKSALCFWNVS